MSTNLKDDEIFIKKGSETNLLKDQELFKKLEDNSHLQKNGITLDMDLISNKNINCSLANEWNSSNFPNILVELTNESKRNYPIDNYVNNQTEDNIFYQHPNLINENKNNIIILNSFRDLEVDLVNKWFENYECFDYYLSLYHQELFLNEERKINDIDKLKEKIRMNLEKELKSISNNQTFKFNLVLLKFLLKELSNISLDNIDELFGNLNNLDNYSNFLDEHFEISYLLIKEKKDILKKINNLIDKVLESNNTNKEIILGKLLLYEYTIVFGLKSLYGILIFIKKIKEIEKKSMLTDYIKDLLMNNIKTSLSSNYIKEKNNLIEKVKYNNEEKSYIKLGYDDFHFSNSNLVFINNDVAYFLNENNTLFKLYRLNETKNKISIIETKDKFLDDSNVILFSLEKEYLFGFNNSEFGKSQNCIKLLKVEHDDKNKNIVMQMDEKSKKLLTESVQKSKEINDEIYLNLFSFDENDKKLFLIKYSPITDKNSSSIAIFQYGTSLFILHPIYKKNTNINQSNNNENENKLNNNLSKDYYFSEKYIYSLDEFEIFTNQNKIKNVDENKLYINYKNSVIIRKNIENICLENDNKSKMNIDDILSHLKNKNKFIMINDFLCFTDTCQNFYDIKNKKICFGEKEEKESVLIKDILDTNKDDLVNSIISQYDDSVFFYKLVKTTINNVQEIKEFEYKINNNYINTNIFLKNKNLINKIKNNVNLMLSKNKKSSLHNKEKDIFKEIFQTFDDEDIDEVNELEKKENKINNKNDENYNFIEFILSYLCSTILENNDLMEISKNIAEKKDDENLFQIIKFLKRPYTINIDYPTIKLIEDLIISFSENNEKENINIFCLLFILDYHLTFLSSLKINSKFLFGNIKNIENLISLLKNICDKNKDYKIFCHSLLIKILIITEDYPQEKLNLLLKEILFPIDFIGTPESLSFYENVFLYGNYSKINMKTLITTESSNKFIIDLIDLMLKNENEINISYINEFFTEFILFYNNMISYLLVNINGITFSNFVNKILNLLSKNLTEEKIKTQKILKPLLYYLINQCLNNYKLLPNDFYLQNWSYIYNILFFIQKLRNKNSPKDNSCPDSSNKKDFILDTFNFSAEFPNNKYKEFIFGKLSYEQSFEEENKKNEIKEGAKSNEDIKTNSINTNSPNGKNKNTIYIQLLCINKSQSQYTKKSNNNNILDITNLANNESIFIFENIISNNKVEIINKKFEDIDVINNSIKIRLYPQSLNYLIKLRVSNYLFYNEELDILINPMTELMNKILKKFAFYYTNEENEIFNLFHTRLFSKGFSNNILLTKKESKDEEKILSYLNESNNKEFVELLEMKNIDISNTNLDNSVNNEEEKTITNYNNKNCATYLENENIIKCINIFKEKQNIFIKGEIPDKIVNISFLIILKHENLLKKFVDYTEKLIKNESSFSPDDIYYILFNKCSDLRKTYKEKKDEIIKNEKEKELNDIFDETFNRLYFLFNLNSEGVNKKDKEKNSNNEIINIYIKEHVNNISQIIKNDNFNLSKILEAYRLMQSQARFREMSLIILNNIIQKFEDKECIDNIIENYYKSFCFPNNTNSLKLPNIYESLNSVSENLVKNITNTFYSVINSLLDKLNNYKEKSTNNIDSYFDLTIYLNFLLWKIKRRNYPTTNKIFEFINKNKNPLINNTKNYFFFYNYKKDKKSNINQFKEFRIMDKYATAKILTDIFIYYYQESMIIEMEKKLSSSDNKLDNFNLIKGTSMLINETYDNILVQILMIFDSQFNGLYLGFVENEKIDHNEQAYIKHKLIYNSKLSNLLYEFLKLALSDLDLIFSNYGLWKKLYQLLSFSNYQNTCLIFNLLKKFTNSSFKEFNDIFSEEFGNKYTNDKYYDYLFNIMKDNKYKSLFCDYLNYIYINNDEKNKFLNYIEKKIREDNEIFLLEMFGYKLQYLSHLCFVRVNTNLNLENKPLNYKPSEKELTHLIKNGYYFDNFKENSLSNLIDEKKLKEQEELIAMVNADGGESEYYSDDDEDVYEDEDSDDDDSTNSHNSDGDVAQEDHFGERNLEELMKKEEITRDIKILSQKIYGKTPNFLNVNENEIVVEENYLNVKNSEYCLNKNLIDSIINYLEKQLIVENKFSPKLLMEYISILKCLIANSNNEKVKDFISKNITTLKQIINILIDSRQISNLYSSEIFLLKNKIELALGGLLKLLPNLEQQSKLLLKGCEDEDFLPNKNEKILTKIYSTFISNDSLDNITLFIEPTKKVVIPILNKCDLSELDFMTSEYFCYRKIEIEILNEKVYESLLNKYKKDGKLKEGNKYPDVNDKIIIITEELLKQIGISDYDYFDTVKTIKKLRKINLQNELKNKKSNPFFDEEAEEDEIENEDESNKDESADSLSKEEKNGDKDEKEEKEEKEDKGDKTEDDKEEEEKKENNDKEEKEDDKEEEKEEDEKEEENKEEEEKEKEDEKDEDNKDEEKEDEKEKEKEDEKGDKEKESKDNEKDDKEDDNKEEKEDEDDKKEKEENKDKNEEDNDEKDEKIEEKEEKEEKENKKEKINKKVKKSKKSKPDKKDKKKKKEKKIKQKEPEIFKSEKWNEFYDLLDYKYQLGNCIFLVDNDYFYKFPKKFICYGFDNTELNTKNLTYESLISKIEELTKNVDNGIPDYVISSILNNKVKEKESNNENNENNENKENEANDKDKDKDKENKEENNKNENNMEVEPQKVENENKEEKDMKEEGNLNIDSIFSMRNNIYEMICNKYSIKIKEKSEMVIDRNLEIPKRFADLYNVSTKLFDFASSFKSFNKNNENNLLNSEEYKKLKYLGVYLMKYYITLLLIKNEEYKNLEINDFKFMFYITLYYNNYFGLSEEHNIIKNGIFKFLNYTLKRNDKEEEKQSIKDFILKLINNNVEIFNLDTFFENISSFNSMVQEEFLYTIIKYLINNFVEENDKKLDSMEYIILNNLFSKLKKYYSENSLEKCIIIYRVLYDTIKELIEKLNHNQQKILLMNIFKEQNIIKSLLCVMNNSKKRMQRTDFSIYTIEFLLNILNIFLDKNIYFNKDEIESIDNIQELINLCDDYEIINEKLNSKYIINKLIGEDEEWCKLMTIKKPLPNLKVPKILDQCSYAFQFIEDKADHYKLSTDDNNQNNEDNLNKNYLTSFFDICKKDSKNVKNNENKKQKKNNKEKSLLKIIKNGRAFNTTSNEVLIIHEPLNNIKNICIGEIKNMEEELKNQIIDIRHVFNLNERCLIIIDKNNKFYSVGEWFGNYEDSDEFEIKSRPELDKINNDDKIIYIGNDCIMTKTSIYFVKDNIPRSLPDLESLYDGKICRYSLPELKNGETFIKAVYKSHILLLTNKKNLYGILYKGDYHLLNSSDISDKYALIQIKTPESIEIIDFVSNYDSLLYFGYENKRRTNIVYGNMNTEEFHIFSKNAQRNMTKFVFMKEITFLSDKNITNLFLTDNQFLAFSKPEGKVYYLDENQNGIRFLKYFINLNIQVKDIIQRGQGFFFITEDNVYKDSNNEDNYENNSSQYSINKGTKEDINNENIIKFYRAEENIYLGEKLFFCGNGEISKLVGEEDYMDKIKLKKPKMINLEEEFIKQNYLKKKNDLTLKLKNILYNGQKFYVNFEYYQSFINPKKITEETNYSLKNEKISFNVIFNEEKTKLYSIELISRNDKAIKDEEFEQFLFQITSQNIDSLNDDQKNKYNKIINEKLNDKKYKFIFIQDLVNNEILSDDFNNKEILKIEILKEEIFEFVDYLPKIKKIVFELPKNMKLNDENNSLIDKVDIVKENYKNKIIIENNLEFKRFFVEKMNDSLLEMKMEINNEKIDEFYPEQYKKIKQKVINLLSSINVAYLLEYQKIYPIYLKEMEEIKNKKRRNINGKKENDKEQNLKSLIEYMKEKYQFYDRFIKFSEKPEIIETISNLVAQISKSAENLLEHSAILYNTSLTKILFSNINFLSEKSRIKNFSSNLLLLKHSKYMQEIRIDRMLNLKKCNMNLIDKDLEWSLIAQMYKSPLGREKGVSFFKGRSKNLFQVNLEGEHASDAGGPGREIFSSCFEQLTSCNVDLFIPSPNNKSQTGADRDKYIFNPLGAKNEKYLEVYKFIGKLFGYIISSETYVSLNLSQIVYKQILGMHLEPSDIELIDVQSYRSIIKVLSSNNINQKKALFGIINFTCQLPGGETVELKEKGNSIYLDEKNCDEFLELYLKAMTNQGYLQAKAVQEGLFEVIPEYMLKFLTPSDLEKKICGEQEFDLDLLKNITIYEGYKSTDITIKYFWQFLEECSLDDKCNYLKFVWGRSRLPKDSKGFGKDPHKITKKSDLTNSEERKYLPIAHTCFFELELPPYDNYNILKEKLLYAMRNSVVISDNNDFLDIEI